MSEQLMSEDVLTRYAAEARQPLKRITAQLAESSTGQVDYETMTRKVDNETMTTEVDKETIERELDALLQLSTEADLQDIAALCRLAKDYLARSPQEGDNGWSGALRDVFAFMTAHAAFLAVGKTPPVLPDSIPARLGSVPGDVPTCDLQTNGRCGQAVAAMPNTSKADRPELEHGKKTERSRFLIVDDDPASRQVLGDMLSRYGTCELAADGRVAVDAFRVALESGQPYDAICLDLKLPGMDGHVALEAIRCHEHEHAIYGASAVKVIVTTVARGGRDEARAFKAGCQAFITKPIDHTKLLDTLRKLGVVDRHPGANQRRATRFRDDVTRVLVETEAGGRQPAVVVDESRTGIGLLLDDVSSLRPDQEVKIRYRGSPMAALVRNIQPEAQDGRHRVGFQWK